MKLNIKEELAKAGSVYTDMHFVYASSKHGSGYINMDPLLSNTELMWKIGIELWSPFVRNGVLFETIAAPATGGIALAYATAFSLHKSLSSDYGDPVAAVTWADKDGADFVFERAGFLNHISGKKVLVVEDLLTTGGSVAKVVHEVELGGGEVVGVSAVCNRGGVTAESLGVSTLMSLTEVNFTAVEANHCPLCISAKPIVSDLGHGADFMRSNPEYPGGFISILS